MKENAEARWLIEQLRGIVARYENAELSGPDVARLAGSSVRTFWDRNEAALRVSVQHKPTVTE